MTSDITQTVEQEIHTFTLRFLKSFEYLDMLTFIACFADDSTAFFPTPEPPLRFIGKRAIQEQFEVVFSAIRSHADGPPFHRLPPQDLFIQILGAETALVSFHLLNAERTARRTLVLIKLEGAWRIIHLHASNGPSIVLA